jgi:hypothetical protein
MPPGSSTRIARSRVDVPASAGMSVRNFRLKAVHQRSSYRNKAWARRLVLALSFSCFWRPSLSFAEDRIFIANERTSLGTEVFRSASIRVGDFDNDSDLDIVVANGRHWPEQDFLFLNQGGAKFSVMRPLGLDRTTSYACEVADLDGDGDLDIATGNDMALGRIFLNDGTGHFKEHCQFGEISSVRSLTLADIDRDGDVDILATSRGRQNRIYLNDGAAKFSFGPAFGSPGDSTISVAVGDVNGDGFVDLALANRDGQQNYWLLNNGQAQFHERRLFGSGKDQTRAVAVADLNNDGFLDWVTGNIDQANVVYLGDGKGGVESFKSFGSAKQQTYSLAIMDMDNDGDQDIVAGHVSAKNSVFFNAGDGENFSEKEFGSATTATYGLCVGDFDGDGFVDIAVANSGELNYIYFNRPQTRASKE